MSDIDPTIKILIDQLNASLVAERKRADRLETKVYALEQAIEEDKSEYLYARADEIIAEAEEGWE